MLNFHLAVDNTEKTATFVRSTKHTHAMNATIHTAAIAKLSASNVEMIGVTKVNKTSFIVSTVEARRLFDSKWTEVCDYTVSSKTGRILRRTIVERIHG